ncbi:DUF4382 domain-containing protein [Ferrimonas balearica]|uniref:DUF4382 domain-containing protein n=1 Tax=Ferrimonas balearica TaxID=44012 RepID=UPI001C99CFFD|nr:DUF4382 domain-containing protein [Ferrimonas balearica]MBY5923171.1 DUF4382 domain-containing protein [Ferrimonas balearica]MBY5997453.1 DUF4382 domain-containing protein [Ferrimonas balearica]
MKRSQTFAVASLVGLLAACGGSDDAPATGTLSMGITDGPVHYADDVVIVLSHMVLVPEAGGDPIVFDYLQDENELRSIDLLEVQGAKVEWVITDRELPVGNYDVCAYIIQGDGSETTSHVNIDDGTFSLSTPSGGSCKGFKPDDVDGQKPARLKFNRESQVTVNTGINNFVIDFDLSKGLVDNRHSQGNQTDFKIKPNAVTLVNAGGAGIIRGVLAQQQFDACEADFASLLGASEFSHAAYLYADSRDRTTMGDIAGEEGFPADSTLVEPVTVAPINLVEVEQEDGSIVEELQYEFGFIGEGIYSIGYTCVANVDQPDTHETQEDGFAIYQHYTPVEVKADEETIQDLDPIL